MAKIKKEYYAILWITIFIAFSLKKIIAIVLLNCKLALTYTNKYINFKQIALFKSFSYWSIFVVKNITWYENYHYAIFLFLLLNLYTIFINKILFNI